MEQNPVTGRKDDLPGEGKGPIGRTAVKAFALGATILFAGALYYCYSTGHFLAFWMLTAVLVLGAVFVVSVYRSMMSEAERNRRREEMERQPLGSPKRHAHGT